MVESCPSLISEVSSITQQKISACQIITVAALTNEALTKPKHRVKVRNIEPPKVVRGHVTLYNKFISICSEKPCAIELSLLVKAHMELILNTAPSE